MRTLSLLSLCLLLSAGSYAQQHHLFKKHAGKQSFKQNPLNKTELKHLPRVTATFYWFSNSWNLSDTTYSLYNPQGLVVSELHNLLSGEQRQTNYTYDAAGRQTSFTFLTRDDLNLPWDSTRKGENIYDTHGTLISETEYTYDPNGAEWYIDYASKSTLVYNTANQLISEETEYYDEDESGYVKESKGLYEYDSTGKVSALTFMTWDDILNQYQNEEKLAEIIWYKWDNTDLESSLLSSANVYGWDGTTYNLTSRMSNTYDSHDNETEFKQETFDGTTWLLDYADQYLLTYNQDGALTEKIEQSWSTMDSAWNDNVLYSYSNFIQYNGLDKSTRQEIGLTISPNPFSEKAEITIAAPMSNAELAVYDLTGKKLQSHRFVSGKCMVEKGDLAPGVYFYIVTDNQQTVANGKMMIQ